MQFPAQATNIITKLISKATPVILLILLSCILTPHANAQTIPPPNPSPATNLNHLAPNFNPDVPRNQHTFAQSIMIEIISAAHCLLIGIDPVNPSQGCLDIDQQTGKLGLNTPSDNKPQIGGLIGYIPGMFTQLYTPPASSTEFIGNLAGNFGIVKPVIAAPQTWPDGATSLKPLQEIWITMRNISYLIFILIFILIGLGIMLRVKIDPRTVMTLQNQIPRIIISLILITFSYAIVGLMIDLMWASTYTGINILLEVSPSIKAPVISAPNPTGRSVKEIVKELESVSHECALPVLYRLCRPIGSLIHDHSPETKVPPEIKDKLVSPYFRSKELIPELILALKDNKLAPCDNIAIIRENPKGNLLQDPFAYTNTIFRGYIADKYGIINPFNTINDVNKYECYGGITRVTVGTATYVGEFIENLMNNILTSGARSIDDIKCGLVTGSISGCIAGLVGGIASWLSVLIIFCIVVFLLLRVWFELLKAYVMIMLYTIIAPLWILAGLLPSRPLGFKSWITRIFANLLVFPAVALLLLLSVLLMNTFEYSLAEKTGGFLPPLIGNPNMNNLGSIIAFGILLVAPGLLGIIKTAFKAVGQPGTMAASAIGNSLAAGGAFPKGLGKTTWNRAFAPYNYYSNRVGFAHGILAGKDPNSWRYKTYHKIVNNGLPQNKTYGPGGTTIDAASRPEGEPQ